MWVSVVARGRPATVRSAPRTPVLGGRVGEDCVLRDGNGDRVDADPWALDPRTARRRIDLLSLVPLVAIIALVGLVAALVWAVMRSEAEQTRTKLATDALWVEQTLRFQLSVDEDTLVRLALDQAGGTEPAVLEARARLHIATNPEMLSVVWHDDDGKAVRAVPGLAKTQDPDLVARLLRADGASTRPAYGDIIGSTVTMGVRVADGAGLVTATISLPLMLERHIPWWIAEQYGVALADSGGTALVSRARREPDPGNPVHSISFDPPIRGTVLSITPFDPPTAFANALLLSVIAALAAFALLALLVLQASARRRRYAEQRLRAEMAFRRSMEDSLTVGLRAKDHDGRILYANSAFCKLVGWQAEDLVGCGPPMPYWAPDRLEETLARQRALATGGAKPQAFETRFRRADGSEIDVQVYEAPLIDATGTHRGWMGSVIDITDAKRAARLARQQDETVARTGRLVTLGEMASTLAHELNQPLSAIAGYAAGASNLIAQGRTDPELLGPALEKLSLQANRAGQIIRRIQDLVRRREPRFGTLDLATVVTETAGFLAAYARDNRVAIQTELTPVSPVLADRILIEQVLINLIRNGIEAVADAGRAGGAVTVRLRGTADGAVTVEVADQGKGIDPAVADRLFDAFTSTKAEGMGMGLNICRSIVELHRGGLAHRPAAGGGTIFAMTLPAALAVTEDAAE